jgi:hypothetical protein
MGSHSGLLANFKKRGSEEWRASLFLHVLLAELLLLLLGAPGSNAGAVPPCGPISATGER